VAQVMAAEGEATSEAALRKRFERLKLRLQDLARELRDGTPRGPGTPDDR
jgi:hypothetical protein